VKALVVSVLGLIASLNVAVTGLFVATPVALGAGVRPVTVGGVVSGRIVNAWALDVPPPGAGVTTVTLEVPAIAISVAGMVAVSCVTET